METWEWIVIAAVAGAAVLLLFGLIGLWRKRRQRSHLQERFGDEYDRAVSADSRRDAERTLAEVEKEHDELDIRPLSGQARERYLEEWRQAESRFVNDPVDAARAAERVVVRALADCGYPTDGSVEDQARHLAADHPDVAERFRHGEAMLKADADADDDDATENMRTAMLDFRAVLDELVEEGAHTRA
jgi:hypothetical protein